MKKNLLVIALIAICSAAFSQPILITDADWDVANPYDCVSNPGPAPNFFDSGNNASDYGNNETEVITVCPDFAGGANKLGLSFGINTGLTFAVDGSDSIYVYDGPNTASPLVGIHNSVTDPTGFTHQSSFGINPSGCLTIEFRSDAAVVGSGWEANITCLQLPQPFQPSMTGLLNGVGSDIITPADTGYSDVCFGDSILFNATGVFPFSLENTGRGYSQDTNNVSYEWRFSTGLTINGRTAWFTPPARSGYIVELRMTDTFGQVQSIVSKVRVSTIPSFAGVVNARDSICVGDTTVIIGGVTNTDTAGVDPTSANFQLGGSVAGLVYLPDGSGINYTDTITVAGFPSAQNFAAASDIDMFMTNIEHSFLGDLEMQLTCPSGVTATIFNSYSPGIIPGGFGGGATFLGNAFDNNIGTPGVGMEYYFSDVNATWGNMATEFGVGNTVPVTTPVAGNAMNPNGVYLPETSFAAFIGCPLNGPWVITVRDNLGIDDGYIFEWGIFFDPSINPNNETYVPSIVSYQWLTSATVLPGNPTDTFVVVSSDSAGTYGYTFEVTDNFGCVYDTTVNVYFLPGPSIQADDTACAGTHQIISTTSYSGGSWSATGPGNATFLPNNTAENPTVSVDVNGTYTFTFSDNQCAMDSSFDVYFADSVFVWLPDQEICIGATSTINATSDVVEAAYLWNTNATTPEIEVADSGDYFVEIKGLCNTVYDTVHVTGIICDIVSPTVITPNGDGSNDYLVFVGLEYYPGSTLQVFNRWGQKIYESNDYQNNWSPSGVSDGTYFYILVPGGELEYETQSNSFTIFN